ncbi:MAG: filamentous hemagglutinin N-terminal domain-containing protein [Thiofilum sp.]|uniref:two-partner secretion domain-containing protein n=1 Tax=Thiofilum sp. TaxID=2212733 RepID=UPI0025F75259|nr:filamentous hemagglutinin N-terminal domain-containing protein [Thiofilum sp.]MBK8455262.1 filamentous hemagglutinin N-terminal domain-containing protein [Thiofilum sp.]
MRLITVIIILATSLTVKAEIITDGTLGAATSLIGPNYQIDAALGTQMGGNLFHSFSEFSINAGEIANFSGSPSVSNVISRVTGSNVSNINGLIRSNIPNADLFFINPKGIIFGKNAQLDVQGSFYASSANYLKFNDGAYFDTNPKASSTLTIAPLASFGFSTEQPLGKIVVKADDFYVSNSKSLNIIGGDIDITQSDIGKNGLSGGSINIISSAKNNNVNFFEDTLRLEKNLGATINLYDNARITTSTYDTKNAGNINLQADRVNLASKSQISSDTHGVGNAGNININSNSYSMSGSSGLSTNSFTSGHAGKININTQLGLLADDAFITSNTYFNSGNAGDITIKAEKSFNISSNGTVSTVAHRNTSGNAGNITISTPSLSIKGNGDIFNDGDASEDSALITSNTLSGSIGKGGAVNINTDQLILDSGATIAVAGNGYGDAGDINIVANSNVLVKDSFISSKANIATGGNINLKNAKLIDLKNSKILASVSGGVGNGGNINFDNVELVVLDRSRISADSTGAQGGKLNLQSTLLRNPTSTTTARGVVQALDGEVFIANEVNPNNMLNTLRLDFLANEIKPPCSIAVAEEESSLTIEKRSKGVDCQFR